jgi:alkyl sulfatase-like protein
MTGDVLELAERLWRGGHPRRCAAGNLMDRPYLRPVYDRPEFIVHTVWRLYGGWWDGNPASLKPAPERALAAELAALAGGPQALADRALAMLAEARSASASERDSNAAATAERADEALRLAGHLAELAWLAAPGDLGIGRVRHEVFSARADTATSTMAAGVFRWAAQESAADA